MTYSTHVERLRAVALPAAAALAKGPTGVAVYAAKQGYGAAKKGQKARRSRVVAPIATRATALPASRRAAQSRAAGSHASQSSNVKRVALLGALAVIAVGAVAYLARGRQEQPPVAAAPPSLADYGPAGAGVPVI